MKEQSLYEQASEKDSLSLKHEVCILLWFFLCQKHEDLFAKGPKEKDCCLKRLKREE